MVFKELTTGAASDLQQASELARSLVTRYGMSEKLGPMTFGEDSGVVFLGKEITEQKKYSEKMAAEIDKEIEKLIRDAQKTAEKILKQRRRKLTKIAKRLIEKEVIERKEFEGLMK
jgi:cell division protease FtsH